MNLNAEKQKWRDSIKSSLKAAREQQPLMQEGFSRSLQLFLKQQTGLWSAYQALTDEVSVLKAVSDSRHLQWAFPRVIGNELEFCFPKIFVKGPWGILEPSADSPICEVRSLTGMLIPGLGFSKQGHRLGRGKGFFDRALSQHQGLKVGVCFDLQLFDEELPFEEHDVAMDWIITENLWVDCIKKEVHPWKSLSPLS
ncbi:MAG: 5-formyltetrahydrofolate cyclo-ligase [Bdellovibrionia bacterium]